MARRPTVLVAALATVLCGGLGLSVAVAQSPAMPAEIVVRVPGARNVSIYCGGDETVHARGSEARIAPATRQCVLTAPWTPVMPLRGEFEVAGSVVECRRVNMRLRCD
ncbi:MAG: hypothetical protein AAF602_31600 [Myxococcota bacterium]